MPPYEACEIRKSDRRALAEVDALLRREGLCRDENLDYTCGIYDDEETLIATGSCFQNTLRCFAVDGAHRGEGLLNTLVSHLVTDRFSRGYSHLFVYAKPESAGLFETLGFFEIARVERSLVFLENRRTGFTDYCAALAREGGMPAHAAAIVLNANPFTLGHRFLVERAAAEAGAVHLFLVSEDVSAVPFGVRKRLVLAGTRDIPGVIHHDSGPYCISNATFPSYFLKGEAAVVREHARLDAAVFERIASALGIEWRYLGSEPFCKTTAAYLAVLQEELPKAGVACVVVPRRACDGIAVSATAVRQCLIDGDFAALRALVPKATYDYWISDEAQPVLTRMRVLAACGR